MILNPLVSHFLRLLNSQNLRRCVKSGFFFFFFFFSWKAEHEYERVLPCQQQQYGSSPSATLKMNEQHLSSPNNKCSQHQKNPPTLGARWAGRLPAVCMCHSNKNKNKTGGKKKLTLGKILQNALLHPSCSGKKMTKATYVRWLERA